MRSNILEVVPLTNKTGKMFKDMVQKNSNYEEKCHQEYIIFQEKIVWNNHC